MQTPIFDSVCAPSVSGINFGQIHWTETHWIHSETHWFGKMNVYSLFSTVKIYIMEFHKIGDRLDASLLLSNSSYAIGVTLHQCTILHQLYQLKLQP